MRGVMGGITDHPARIVWLLSEAERASGVISLVVSEVFCIDCGACLDDHAKFILCTEPPGSEWEGKVYERPAPMLELPEEVL